MRIEKRGAHIATAVWELEVDEAGLVVLRESLRGGGLVHGVVPQQRAHICARTPRHGIRARVRYRAGLLLFIYIYRRRDRREGLAFGDVVDLAGGRVGEEPGCDLPLLAVTERLAGAAFVRHFRALERRRRVGREVGRRGWEKRRRRRGVRGRGGNETERRREGIAMATHTHGRTARESTREAGATRSRRLTTVQGTHRTDEACRFNGRGPFFLFLKKKITKVECAKFKVPFSEAIFSEFEF